MKGHGLKGGDQEVGAHILKEANWEHLRKRDSMLQADSTERAQCCRGARPKNSQTREAVSKPDPNGPFWVVR
jgi:hypothetical protein